MRSVAPGPGWQVGVQSRGPAARDQNPYAGSLTRVQPQSSPRARRPRPGKTSSRVRARRPSAPTPHLWSWGRWPRRPAPGSYARARRACRGGCSWRHRLRTRRDCRRRAPRRRPSPGAGRRGRALLVRQSPRLAAAVGWASGGGVLAAGSHERMGLGTRHPQRRHIAMVSRLLCRAAATRPGTLHCQCATLSTIRTGTWVV